MFTGTDISVIIATHNRAEILRQTLESMTSLVSDNLSVEFVIVDNDSSDNTRHIVKSFESKLSICYLFEPRPGKNCALNKAINEVNLGNLVVFTDDDVKPHIDWIQTIVSASKRWSDYSVFGGKQYPIFPRVRVPKWALSKFVMELAFGLHDRGDEEEIYGANNFPFGANFWVRREVITSGCMCFDENVAWHPKNRILGTETIFLRLLADKGYDMIYCPGSIVGHRIRPKQISKSYLLARAYAFGRGKARLRPLCRADLFYKHSNLWYIIRVMAIVKIVFRFVLLLVPLVVGRPLRATYAIQWIGYNMESIRIAKEKLRERVL